MVVVKIYSLHPIQSTLRIWLLELLFISSYLFKISINIFDTWCWKFSSMSVLFKVLKGPSPIRMLVIWMLLCFDWGFLIKERLKRRLGRFSVCQFLIILRYIYIFVQIQIEEHRVSDTTWLQMQHVSKDILMFMLTSWTWFV